MPKTKKNKHRNKKKFSEKYYYLISTIENKIISKVKKKNTKSNNKLIFLIEKKYEPHINNNVINGNIIPFNGLTETIRICEFIEKTNNFKPSKINNILFKINITTDIDLNDLKWSNKKIENGDDDNDNKEEDIDEDTIVDWNIENNIDDIDDKKEKKEIMEDIEKHKKDQKKEKNGNNPFLELRQFENNKEQKFNLIVKNNGITKNKKKNNGNTNSDDDDDDDSDSSDYSDSDDSYVSESSSSGYEYDYHFNNIFNTVTRNKDGSNNKSPFYYRYKNKNCKFYFELNHEKKKIYLVKFLIEF